MPYLTLNKEDKNKPIAILKMNNGSNKVVYISDKENSNDLNDNNELDFIDIDKRIKGNNTKEKIKIFDMIQKGLSKNIKVDDLMIENDEVKKVYKDIQDEAGKIIKVGHNSSFEPLPTIPDDKGNSRDCIYITGCSGSGKSWWRKCK